MVKKKYRSRKNCIHYKTNQNKEYTGIGRDLECFGKVGRWFCIGVNCKQYKEKEK